MKNSLFALLLGIIAFSSCTPQRKIKRLCKNYPLLCESRTTIDTVYQIRFAPRLDTVSVVEHLTDTVEVVSDGDTIRVVLRQDTIFNRDTIELTHISKPDTITTIKWKEKVVYDTASNEWWWRALFYILGVLSIVGLMRWANSK